MELFFGVESIVLAKGGIVVSKMLEDLVVESSSHWGNNIDAHGEPTQDIRVLDHYIKVVLLAMPYII